MRRWLWVLLIVLSLPFVGLATLWLLEPYLVPAAPPLEASGEPPFGIPASEDDQPAPFDVSVAPLELLPSGTVVEETPPEGWTHLIIKSRPFLSSGAIEKLSEEGQSYATFLFMTTVARISPKQFGPRRRFGLDAVALGMGVTVKGKDRILSPETLTEQAAHLGLAHRLIFRGAYNKQRQVHFVARSPTFALYDTPAMLSRQGDHRDVILRYALLVDPQSGRLDTLVWLIDRQEGEDWTPEPVEWLAPNLVAGPPLHVEGDLVRFGIPLSPHAFAVERLPPGQRQLAIPSTAKALLGQERFDADEARKIDQTLRELMRSAKP